MKNCIKCSCELTDITWASDQKINYINKCRECIKVEKREDSTKGYIKDNIQVISYLANVMKSHATDAELLQFAHGVIGMLGLGGMRTAEKIQGVAAK